MSQVDLTEYEKDPSNTAALLDLAKQCSDQGKNDSAMLFAEAALTAYTEFGLGSKETQIGALERISIAAFYSKIAARRALGKQACEILAMDRSVPWVTRNIAGQNSTWYSKSANDIMPGVTLTQVDFTPPDDYQPMNPSIITWRDQLWMIQRTVNYVITPSGHYDMRGDTAIRTRNWLLRLNDDLSVASANEISMPTDLPEPLYGMVLGFEDSRLFAWGDALWCTSTVRELNQPGYCEIVLARIDLQGDGNYRYSNWRAIQPQGVDLQHQKNWMPLVMGDDLRFVYSSDPVRIIDDQGRTVSLNSTGVASDSFRGGSQAIPFDDGRLAIIHESHNMNDGRRRYMHRFVKYDPALKLVGYTEAFHIAQLGIEFAAGIATNPATGDIVVSFGLADKESWLATFSPDRIRAALITIPEPKFEVTLADGAWIAAQTNQALQDKATVDHAGRILSGSSLPHHEDAVKNWDNLISLWHTIESTAKSAPVMDVAATVGSAYLPSLAKFGYEELISINLTQTQTEVVDGVIYQYGDCTKTDFADGYFGFISCLSVIEHGVDVESFMRESARILQTGGHLFVSTDYWQDTVDTGGQMAFGVPVRIFTADDIREMISIAEGYGLEITSDVNLECDQRVVNWIGMDYTFVNLLFRKN